MSGTLVRRDGNLTERGEQFLEVIHGAVQREQDSVIAILQRTIAALKTTPKAHEQHDFMRYDGADEAVSAIEDALSIIQKERADNDRMTARIIEFLGDE